MQPAAVIYLQYAALSLLIVGGLVASTSLLFVIRSADTVARTWFASIALQLMSGMVLFTVGTAWREAAYFVAVLITLSSHYLALFSTLLMLGETACARRLSGFLALHMLLFVLTRLAPSTDLSYLFSMVSSTALEGCILVALQRIRKEQALTATLFAELAFGAGILGNLIRIGASIHIGRPVLFTELSIYSVIAMSLQCVFIVMSCFYYFGISIQRAEAREMEMRLEADRLRVSQRLAEEHARETAQLIAERDQMMLLNSRFSTINTLSLLGGGVIHEIAQPLQAARSAIDVLAMQKSLTPDELAQHSSGVQRLIDRVAGIVENLRRLMREKTVDLEPVDCVEIINRVFPIFRSEARRRDVETICLIDPAAAGRLVRANPVMLERVLFNLAANAIEAFDMPGEMPGESEDAASTVPRQLVVRIGMAGHNGQSHLTIGFDDTGSGVPDARYAEIFELLTSGKAEGTGLGLYMVKAFVESWRGTIRAMSNLAAGQGTSIEIMLPVHAPA